MQMPLILHAQPPNGTALCGDSSVACSNRGRRSFGDSLRAHGIDLSESSLIAALQNNDPEVRSLAVAKLLEDHDLQSVSSIEKVLSAETNSNAKVEIAGALASFGDPLGAKYLVAMCTDPSLPTLAMSAAVHGLALAHYSHPQFTSPAVCADTVLDLFDNRPDSKVDMVELFAAMYHEVSQSQADRMFADAQSLLQSDSLSSRIVGSDILASLGFTAALDLLHTAMESATDPVERLSYYSDYLTLLPAAIKTMPKDQADSKIAEVEGLLQDNDPNLRTDAARALAQIASTSSLEALRVAILRETIPDVREDMQILLDAQTKLQQQGVPDTASNPQP